MSKIQYIHTADDARKVDFETIQIHHVPSLILMEHAACESVQIIESYIKPNQRICILCGPGNNGGDGLAIARLLGQKGILSSIYVPAIEKMSVDEKIQYDAILNYDVFITDDLDKIRKDIQYADIIVDCIFGNGLSREITGKYAELIECVNASNAHAFSIDIPSGIHATTGKKLGVAVKADHTIALDCFKLGHFQQDGLEYCGNVQCVDIGILDSVHKEIPNPIYHLDEYTCQKLLPKRENNSHKGTFKKGLMIGGSTSMHGALTLAANACYRSGIGTLTLMIPDAIGDVIAKKMDFAMNLRKPSDQGFFAIPNIEELSKEISPFQLIAIGNGIGRNESSIEYVKAVLSTDKPVIVDADAIWALSQTMDYLDREAPVILTPHLKEMSFLCKESVKEIMMHPYESAKRFVDAHKNCIVILKSSTSFIVSKDESYVLSRPNSALAKGGSGDILCGIVTGLCGQTNDYVKACAVGAYIHSMCADTDKDPACMMPDDCVNEIENVFKKLRVEMK